MKRLMESLALLQLLQLEGSDGGTSKSTSIQQVSLSTELSLEEGGRVMYKPARHSAGPTQRQQGWNSQSVRGSHTVGRKRERQTEKEGERKTLFEGDKYCNWRGIP